MNRLRWSAAAALTVTCVSCGCSARPGPGVEVAPLAPATAPAELGDRALEHVAALVSFGARHAGSPGWRSSVDYIAGQLEAMGLPARRDRWTDPSEGLTFENLSATIPGARPARIVIAAHHDTKVTSGHPDPAHNFEFVGANDSGSGVGLLLELARHLLAHPPGTTVEVVFFDGEESLPFDWKMERALFGSRRYVRLEQAAAARAPDRPPIRAMILLDMVGAADLTIDDETLSDRGLHAIFAAAARACGHQESFFANALEVSDDHLPFVEAGIPAIDLIDIYDNPEWHTADDTLERMSARSLQAVGEVVLTALPAVIDRCVARSAVK